VTELSPELVVEAPAAGRRRHPVLGFVARRVAAGILTLLVVSILLFVGTTVLPGDPATAILGRNSTPQALVTLRRQLNLDDPLPQRYWSWLSGFVQGDLGRSATGQATGQQGGQISDLISGRVTNTLVLALLAVAFMVPLSIVIGVFTATRAGRPIDHAVSLASLTAISLPEFVTGTLLVLVFAVWLGWLPGVSIIPIGESVWSNAKILVLPVMTLLAASVAQSVRMVRAGMLDALRSDYVEWSRLSGFGEWTTVYRHALRNALAPTVQVLALNIQWLVGGIVVTEFVFGYPGLGQALVQAVAVRDIPFVLSVGMLIAIVYISLNILADLLVVFLVPKLRTAQL
jgi:peptide/nickel transport system permease protein